MTMIVYSYFDEISRGVGEILLKRSNATPIEEQELFVKYASDLGKLVKIGSRIVDAEFLDHVAEGEDMILISRHTSKEGVLSMTTHAPGNWSEDHRDGGRPKELSVAAPKVMLSCLSAMSKLSRGITVTYEATHHGPFLKTPSVFVEVGGPEHVSPSALEALADSVEFSIRAETGQGRSAIGIGCGHYPSKFTRLAIEGKYAFGHIMPKHYCNNLDMIKQAVERSKPRPEVAVIEWKGLNSPTRAKIIEELGGLGLDYERV